MRYFHKLKEALLLLCAIMVLVGCIHKLDDNKTVLARVGEEYLYFESIEESMPVGLSKKDSVVFLKRFVDSWIDETLSVQKAENNLTEEQKNVEKQLKDYRNSLIKYKYEKGIVRQYLDTLVTLEEVEQYYKENQNDFELKDNIVRVVYVKINKEAPKIDEIRKLYKSNNIKDREQLAEYCHQFAINFYLNDDTWLLFDELLKEVPIKTYNKELFLKQHRYVQVSDSLNVYLLNIKEYRIRESISPLDFEQEHIRNIILNKRKLKLISDMKKSVYQEAIKKNKIEIFIGNDVEE